MKIKLPWQMCKMCLQTMTEEHILLGWTGSATIYTYAIYTLAFQLGLQKILLSGCWVQTFWNLNALPVIYLWTAKWAGQSHRLAQQNTLQKYQESFSAFKSVCDGLSKKTLLEMGYSRTVHWQFLADLFSLKH